MAKPSPRAKLSLEALEDRLVPAVVDFYFPVDPIGGETPTDGANAHIEIASFSFGTSKASPGGSSQSPDVFQLRDLDFNFAGKKVEEKAITLLFQQATTGNDVPKLHFNFTKSGDSQQPYLSYQIQNVLVSTVQLSGSGSGETSPQESIKFDFTALNIDYTKGKEQITVHGQFDSTGRDYDITIEHDETHWVGQDRTKSIERDETIHVKMNRTETVDNNESITVHMDRTETVDNNEAITVGGNRTDSVNNNETITINGNRTVTVGGNETITLGGNSTQTVNKDETITIPPNVSIYIFTGIGTGADPQVQTIDNGNLAPLKSFFTFDPMFTGGVFVAAGDINGDGSNGQSLTNPPSDPFLQQIYQDILSRTDPASSFLQSFQLTSPSFTGPQTTVDLSINPGGSTTTLTRVTDASGNIIEETKEVKYLDGSSTTTVTHTFYFAGSSISYTTVTQKQVMADGSKTYTSYDNRGHQVSSHNVKNENDGSVTFTDFDNTGKPFRRTNVRTNADGSITTTSADLDAQGNITKATVVTVQKNADGSTTTTTQEFDSNGKLTKHTVTDDTKNADGSTTSTTSEYDGNGKLVKKTVTQTGKNADGSTTTTVSEYDGNGKLVKKTVSKLRALPSAASITLKTGDATIVMKKDGNITVKGKNITIAGSGNVSAGSDGLQTAVVVGPGGDEIIFTDKYGRVKVQFFWDRQGKGNTESSAWIRVDTLWAGKQWGMISNPQIGQEVIVAFEEGDPDRPIIVGSVTSAN